MTEVPAINQCVTDETKAYMAKLQEELPGRILLSPPQALPPLPTTLPLPPVPKPAVEPRPRDVRFDG